MYSDLLSDERVESNFICVLIPKRKVITWTLFSGSVYVSDFDYTNHIVSVTENGVALTAGSSVSLSAGQFFYNDSQKKLYVRTGGSVNPSTRTMIAHYEIYVGTKAAHFHRDPADDTTQVVYFEPFIVNSPVIKETTTDVAFGFMPNQSSRINLGNAEHSFEKHTYDSSFSKAPIRVYHWLDELIFENIKLVLDGVCSNVGDDNASVSISVNTKIDEFKIEYRNQNDSFFDLTNFPDVNPIFVSKPIRYVYGRVTGFVPVNIDYLQEEPTTSDNRQWVAIGEQSGLAEITKVVQASPAPTNTQTPVLNVNGLTVGDTIWLDGATDRYAIITALTPTMIFHTDAGGAATAGDIVRRGFVSRVDIIQDGVTYTALYGRDYTVSTALPGGTSGFNFSTSLESNLSMPDTLRATDTVYCTVYGRTNDLTLGGPSFGANDTATQTLSHPVLVLYDILKTRLGLGEDKLDLDSFQDLFTGSEAIGFAIPDRASSGFPNFQSIIADILKTSLLRLVFTNEQKFKLFAFGPLGAPAKEIASDEIIDYKYDFSYSEILSEVRADYAFEEYFDRRQTVISASNDAQWVHGVNVSKTFESMHMREADAQVLADRLRYYLGDRIGKITIRAKNRFFDLVLGDVIRVSRDKLPGFEYVRDTDRERDFLVVETNKALRGVTFIAEDIKGVQDNSGSW